MARPKSKPSAPQSPLASKIVERWSGTGGEVTLDRLLSELDGVSRYDVVAALKELERAGVGRFTVQRQGQPTRFVWSRRAGSVRTSGVSTAKRSAKKSPAITAAPTPKVTTRPLVTSKAKPLVRGAQRVATLEHTFHLRPGYSVEVVLPADVTRAEIERFCKLLQAIPFDRTR